MRIFTVSDLHIDYKENRDWLFGLSQEDYKDDILILAGDITSNMSGILKSFVFLKKCFKEIIYLPGNHDLWVNKKESNRNSLDNFNLIRIIANNCGIMMNPARFGSLSIVPLFGWYDYSFGEPSKEIFDVWVDYQVCEWPEGEDERSMTKYFVSLNEPFLDIKNDYVITFSHFVPRIDVMPFFVPQDKRILYPVLGSILIEKQIRRISPNIHIYGHSHLNMRVHLENIEYINNAFGYPSEKRIAIKKLLKIYEI